MFCSVMRHGIARFAGGGNGVVGGRKFCPKKVLSEIGVLSDSHVLLNLVFQMLDDILCAIFESILSTIPNLRKNFQKFNAHHWKLCKKIFSQSNRATLSFRDIIKSILLLTGFWIIYVWVGVGLGLLGIVLVTFTITLFK